MDLSVTRDLRASREAVWRAFEDWGGVWRFQPWVVRSPILGEIKSGVGAQRRCEFLDNTSIVETVKSVDPLSAITLDMSETPKPMKDGTAKISLSNGPTGGTRVTVGMNVSLSMGPLNPIIANLMMKPMMRKRITLMLESLDHYLATGRKLSPSGEEAPLNDAHEAAQQRH